MFDKDKLSFDPKVHQAQLYEAWKVFVNTGTLNRNDVPAAIADSWERSRAYNVDPWDIPATAYLSQRDLQERLKKNEFLVKIAKPFMEEVHRSLAESKYVLVLDDAEGYLLVRTGTLADFERAKKFKIKLGLCRSEETLGTTGFSLVHRHGKAIQITGCEHYNSFFHYIVGSYAPIRNPKNREEILGVIGIAGARTFPNDQNLALAIATANSIENFLKLSETNRILTIYGRALRATIDKMSDGCLIFDNAGLIYELNRSASKILRLPEAEIKNKRVSEIGYKSLEESVNAILKSKDSTGKEEELEINGRRYLASIKFAEGEKKEIGGAVVFLKDFLNLTKIATKISENGVRYSLSSMVGSSKYMEEIREFVRLVAPSNANIIIEGESGTGKEVLAHIIHDSSARMNEAFVAADCSAVPSELFESLFFGHEKGAFTNAYKTHVGKFELADKGTIFLDEIADMPTNMQVKLLRVLEERVIERVGSQRPIHVDVRVIAATNKDLLEEVRRGAFRRDLFYRLNVFKIKLPALRDRKGDIADLVKSFVEQLTYTLNKRVFAITPDFVRRLMDCDWPGNIRELKNAVYHAMTLMEDETLDESCLRNFFIQTSQEREPGRVVTESDARSLLDAERDAIKKTLLLTRGNKRQAAKILGIGRNTLHRKLKLYALPTMSKSGLEIKADKV